MFESTSGKKRLPTNLVTAVSRMLAGDMTFESHMALGQQRPPSGAEAGDGDDLQSCRVVAASSWHCLFQRLLQELPWHSPSTFRRI